MFNHLTFFRWLIVENFVPTDVFDNLRERCQYDPDEDTWTIGKPSSQANSVEDQTRTMTDKPMLDSGLASSSDVSSTGGESTSGLPNKALFAKRPVSLF